MRRIRPILCCVICILSFSILTAQLSSKKEPINDVGNENLYAGKWWNVKQILKESVSFKYISVFYHSAVLTISRSSMIYLSITELPAVPVRPTVSDKLQSHLETSRFYESDTYSRTILTSCWSLYPPKYERPIVGKFFFTYQ